MAPFTWWGVPLLACVLVVSSSGCVVRNYVINNRLDAALNPWLGKSKDERVKQMGPANQCAKLSSGEEACEWKQSGVSQSNVDCSWDYTHGGHECRGGGGGSWRPEFEEGRRVLVVYVRINMNLCVNHR